MSLADRIRAARVRYRAAQSYGGTVQGAAPNAQAEGWEWVYTGADFAREHRLGKFGGWLWLMLFYVLTHLLVLPLFVPMPVLDMVVSVSRTGVLFWLLVALDVVIAVALVRRWQSAYRLS